MRVSLTPDDLAIHDAADRQSLIPPGHRRYQHAVGHNSLHTRLALPPDTPPLGWDDRSRIDLLVSSGSQHTVVEFKDLADGRAIGQVLSYCHLLRADLGPGQHVRPLIICRREHPGLADWPHRQSVRVLLVSPERAPQSARPAPPPVACT